MTFTVLILEPLAVQLRQTLTGTESTTEVHFSVTNFPNQIATLLDAKAHLQDTTPYNVIYIVSVNREKLQELLIQVTLYISIMFPSDSNQCLFLI